MESKLIFLALTTMLVVVLVLYVARIILGLVCTPIAAMAWIYFVFELVWLEGEESVIVQLGVFMPVIMIAVAIVISLGSRYYKCCPRKVMVPVNEQPYYERRVPYA